MRNFSDVTLLRSVQPEFLDSLPQSHPAAQRSRLEIRKINYWMGNFRWFANYADRLLQENDRILELGAGCGELGRTIQSRLDRRKVQIAYTGLDLCHRPQQWPQSNQWIRQDLLRFDRYDDFTCIVGNLILHHFTDAQLRQLGLKIKRQARLLLFNEPLRIARNLRIFRWGSRILLSPVSQHDGYASIQAGFLPGELPELLHLDTRNWSICERTTLTGAYRLLAIRQ